MRIYSPAPTRHPSDQRQSESPIVSLHEGAVIGIVDNTKPNARALMEKMAKGLADKIPNLTVIVERKASAAEGVSDLAFGKLADQASLVLVGSGD